MREGWRYVSMGCGELCVTVTIDGTPERPQWCANDLDTRIQVSEIFITALSVRDEIQTTNLYVTPRS